MSFTQSSSRTPPGRSGPGSSASEGEIRHESAGPQRATGSPYRRTPEWEQIGLVGAGLVVGALLGAGLALLLAPQSGAEARSSIVRRVQSARDRTSDAWVDLGSELRRAARRRRRQAHRAVARARWAASDAVDG